MNSRTIILILWGLFAWIPTRADFFDDANRFFMLNVEDGGVKYEKLHNDPASLNKLAASIADFKLDNADRNTKKAFYLNAYNVLMIKSIVDNYPVASPLDIGGVFDKNRHEVAGQMLTLDAIEKEILMKEFFDPRLHFVLVCGAKGCPPLAPFAYMPGQLDELLKSQTRKALSDGEFIRVNHDASEVGLSKIFKWYKADYLKQYDHLIAYINQYREEPIPESYSVTYYEYDWSLNKKKVK